MMEPKFIIYVETSEGVIFKAFTWCRDAISGIARAKRDAIDFRVEAKRIWAEPVGVK